MERVKPSVNVRQIDNGYLVSLNSGIEQREIHCKNIAQVVKAIKLLMNEPEEEPVAPTPKAKLGKK
jgi:hypothetical protein